MKTTLIETGALTPSELNRCRGYVEQTINGATAATRGLSEVQWNFKSAPDRWSIAQILEHMVFIQELVLGPIRDQLAHAPMAGNRSDCGAVDDLIVNGFPDRSVKFQAPEVSHPAGRWSPPVALGRLMANGRSLVEYVAATPDLRQRTILSAPLQAISKGEFKQMDGYQWVLGVAAHTERHTKQVVEVRVDPAFPA